VRILVVLDGTHTGEPAARAVAPWVRAEGLEVVLFSVLDPAEIHDTISPRRFSHALTPSGTAFGQTLGVFEPYATSAEDRGQAFVRARNEREDYLRTIGAELFPGVPPTILVEEGHETAASIVAAARSFDVAFIAITARGRGGVSQALFGAIHEDVVRHAPVPVIVVGPAVPV
jgi:nucleotide-binding universal stress UspA family protein